MTTEEISDEVLRQAFEGMVARLPSRTVLRGDALADYVRQMRSAFEANLHRDTATVEGNAAFIALQSTSHYVGYPGVNQVTIELEVDASASALGDGLAEVLRASTRMTLDFLNEAVPRVERDEGMARDKAYIDDLCRRHGYKTKKALFKSTRMVHVDRHRSLGDIILRPPIVSPSTASRASMRSSLCMCRGLRQPRRSGGPCVQHSHAARTSTGSRDKLANKVLDIRVQPGGYKDAEFLIAYGKSKGIVVIIKEMNL